MTKATPPVAISLRWEVYRSGSKRPSPTRTRRQANAGKRWWIRDLSGEVVVGGPMHRRKAIRRARALARGEVTP